MFIPTIEALKTWTLEDLVDTGVEIMTVGCDDPSEILLGDRINAELDRRNPSMCLGYVRPGEGREDYCGSPVEADGSLCVTCDILAKAEAAGVHAEYIGVVEEGDKCSDCGQQAVTVDWGTYHCSGCDAQLTASYEAYVAQCDGPEDEEPF